MRLWARGSKGRRKVQSWGLDWEGELLAGVKNGATQVETGKNPGWRGPCGQSSEEMGLGCGGGNLVPEASGIQRRY